MVRTLVQLFFLFLGLIGILFFNDAYGADVRSQPPSSNERSELIRELFQRVGDPKNSMQKLQFIQFCLNKFEEAEVLGRQITVAIKRPEFNLEEVVQNHPLLGSVPIEKLEIVEVESKRVPDVINAYVKVPGSYVRNPDIFAWMPSEKNWLKYIDPVSNGIHQHKDGTRTDILWQQAALFYDANKVLNEEIVKPVEKSGNFNWDLSPHPSNTEVGSFYIPVGTVKVPEKLLAQK